MIKRIKKLKKDDDLNAKHFEEILDEVTREIPTEDDYRVNIVERKTITNIAPKGMRHGEIRIDSSTENKKLAICIEDNGIKKIFGIDLIPVTETGEINADWNATSGTAEILNKPSAYAMMMVLG